MKFKKYISLLLAVVVMIGFLPGTLTISSAEETYESDINVLKELGVFDVFLDSQTLITRSLFFDMQASSRIPPSAR